LKTEITYNTLEVLIVKKKIIELQNIKMVLYNKTFYRAEAV